MRSQLKSYFLSVVATIALVALIASGLLAVGFGELLKLAHAGTSIAVLLASLVGMVLFVTMTALGVVTFTILASGRFAFLLMIADMVAGRRRHAEQAGREGPVGTEHGQRPPSGHS